MCSERSPVSSRRFRDRWLDVWSGAQGTNGIPINYRLNEMSDGIGRAAVLAGKRAQEIR
jgi:hypothetical protein